MGEFLRVGDCVDVTLAGKQLSLTMTGLSKVGLEPEKSS